MVADELASTILSFIGQCREPAVMESGDEPMRLAEGSFSLDVSGGRVVLEAWDERRNLARRVVRVVGVGPGRMEVEVLRLGKRVGTLSIVDRGRATAAKFEKRAQRHRLRERLRSALARQFAGWRVAELTAEADLEHSLSPSYARAVVKKGNSAWVILAAPDEAAAADGALTFGLIWLDYVRRREKSAVVEGLCLMLPAGREVANCLRLRWLNPRVGEMAVLLYGAENDWEDRVDWRIWGNLETRVEVASTGTTAGVRRSELFLEGWMEECIRGDISVVDALLRRDMVYGQVASWASADRGVLDLLAVEGSGRLVVVELKASADPNLPMQALDYWVRVDFHRRNGELAGAGYFPGVELGDCLPRIVLAAPALQFHTSTETILRALSPRIDVERVGLRVEWQQEMRVLFRLRGAQSPH